MNIAQTLFRKGFCRPNFSLWGSLLLGALGGVFFYYWFSGEASLQSPVVTSSFSGTQTLEKATKTMKTKERNPPSNVSEEVIEGTAEGAMEGATEKTMEKRSEPTSQENALPELPGLPSLTEEKTWKKEELAEVPEKTFPGTNAEKEPLPTFSDEFLEEIWEVDEMLSQSIPDELQKEENLPELPQAMVVERVDWTPTTPKEGTSEWQQVHFEEPVSPTLPDGLEGREKINRLPPPPAQEIPMFNPNALENEEVEEKPISQLDPAAMSRQPNADILLSEPLREVVSLDARNADLRLLLARVEAQSGLKIYASPEVQGKISCKIETQDYEEVFRRLLGTTSFTAHREGEFVYVGRRMEPEKLPEPLSLQGTRTFVPQHISPEQLQKTVDANLSPYGKSILHNEKQLIVHDLEVTLRDLEKMVALIDIQGKMPKWDIFVFQHDAPSRKQPLDLQKIAENRGISLQETTPQWLGMDKSRKKEVPARLFTISHRMDTFLIGLEDQKKVELISDRNADSDLVLEVPRTFPFSLKLGEKQENYVAEVTFSTSADSESSAETLAVKIDCQPQKKDAKGERWTLQTTMEMERGLLLQGFLTEYKPEKEENKPFQSFPGKKTPVEMVLTLITRLEEPPRPETTFSSAAIRFLAKQQETIGYKIMETAQGEERKKAQSFLQTSQRLRNLVYDVKIR